MKYLVLLILFLFVSINIVAQCKYEKNDIDPFEKVQRVETKRVKIFWPTWGGGVYYAALAKIDTSYYFKLTIYVPDAICINDGYQLIVLDEGDDVYRFTNIHGLDCTNFEYSQASKNHNAGVFYYKASKEDLIKLSTRKMYQFRIQGSDGYWDQDINKSNSSKQSGLDFFINTVPCILN